MQTDTQKLTPCITSSLQVSESLLQMIDCCCKTSSALSASCLFWVRQPSFRQPPSWTSRPPRTMFFSRRPRSRTHRGAPVAKSRVSWRPGGSQSRSVPIVNVLLQALIDSIPVLFCVLRVSLLVPSRGLRLGQWSGGFLVLS